MYEWLEGWIRICKLLKQRKQILESRSGISKGKDGLLCGCSRVRSSSKISVASRSLVPKTRATRSHDGVSILAQRRIFGGLVLRPRLYFYMRNLVISGV